MALRVPDHEDDGNGRRSERLGFGIGHSKDLEKLLTADERAEIQRYEKSIAPAVPYESRCLVCKHPNREWIDLQLIKGQVSLKKISESLGPDENGRLIDYRSISNHSKKHLAINDHAIRAILEEEANQNFQDFSDGVRGAITHRGALEVAFRRALDDVVSGIASVEVRDMVKIAETLRKWDQETRDSQIEEYQRQVEAFMQAIRHKVPRDYWNDVTDEARRLYEGREVLEIEPPQDAEVVNADEG